jgi:hypothetical protein
MKHLQMLPWGVAGQRPKSIEANETSLPIWKMKEKCYKSELLGE